MFWALYNRNQTPKCPKQGFSGWSVNAKMLGKLSVPDVLLWTIVGQGPIALAVGEGWDCLDIFSLFWLYSFLSPSLGDSPIYTDILSQKVVKPKTINQAKSSRALNIYIKLTNNYLFNSKTILFAETVSVN